MPVINLDVAKLTKEQKETLVKELTIKANEITGIPQQEWYVFINEHELDNVGVNGILLSNRK